MTIATCIGCGCHDYQACYDDETDAGCLWERVDPRAGLGICSCCKEYIEAWDAGDRQRHVPVELESQSGGLPNGVSQ